MVRKILQPIYTFYVVITFIISIILAFPVIAILSIGNNNLTRNAIYSIIRYWSIGWLFLIGMPVKIKGAIPFKEKYIIVSNHVSYLDTLVIFPAISSYFRPLGKKEITKIPLVGFIYKQVVILVDRSDTASRSKSMRLMLQTLKKESNIVIFPEGTFNEKGTPLKEFYDGAFRLAINAQTNILPLILPDTVKRWHYSAWWKIWPGKNRAIFLPPVKVEGMDLSQLPVLKQIVFSQMENAILKYREC